MGELIFIGLGLDDEKGITLRGLDEARSADVVFAELYTSALPGASLEAVEKLIGREIRRLTRQEVEDGEVLLTAAASGAVGLQAYKFGRTTTVPFPAAGFAPTSPLEAILANRTAGLHTLVLLDLREDGTFLAPRDAIASLLRMASSLETIEFGPHTLACVLSRVGSPGVRAFAGPISELAHRDLGPPPHCLVIPGTLHFLEKEALVAFAGAPHDF